MRESLDYLLVRCDVCSLSEDVKSVDKAKSSAQVNSRVTLASAVISSVSSWKKARRLPSPLGKPEECIELSTCYSTNLDIFLR